MTDQLTVFVISAGKNPSLPLCLKQLQAEQAKTPFRLERIEDVRPMGAAFQQMLDRCQTPYFVQVDEDMVLHPGALAMMLGAIRNAPEHIAMIAFRLHDVHLDFDLWGVKIYRADVFKRYPYNLDYPSCEVEQLDRMKADGYEHQTRPEVIGQHAPEWSLPGIFERYLGLMEKFKLFGYAWLEELFSKLWVILQKDPTEQNLYALLGCYTSIIADEPLLTGEKDFAKRLPQEATLTAHLRRPHEVTLYMTSRCNFRCRHCKHATGGAPTAPDMTQAVVSDVLFRFPTIKAACICGFGEPLLNPHFSAVMQFLKFKGIYTGLITNGSLLRTHWPYLVETGTVPDYISVSLNTCDPARHKEITGTETFEEVIAGIKLAIEHGTQVYLSYICTTESLPHVKPFLEFAYFLGVRTVHLHNLLPYAEAGWHDLALLRGRDDAAVEALKALPHANLVKGWPVLVDAENTSRWCQFPWHFVGVDGNGDITLCNSVDAPPPGECNVKDTTIWHSAYAQSVRRRCVAGEGPCAKCFRNWMIPCDV